MGLTLAEEVEYFPIAGEFVDQQKKKTILLGRERICKDCWWLIGIIFSGNILLDLSQLQEIMGIVIFTPTNIAREFSLLRFISPPH